ncbi:MAG: response regulator [Bacilli bacterium]|nr:response regulator [Bacilli bacterium]
MLGNLYPMENRKVKFDGKKTAIYNKQFEYLLNNDPEKVFSKLGINIRRVINPLLKTIVPLFAENKIVIEKQSVILEKTPIIFAPTHGFRDDICDLIISVKDTGRGIKPDDINKLFLKFERLDIERNTTAEGTGLGLAITKKLVEIMGGKINVESHFGKGTLFIVHIPQKIEKHNKPITDENLIDAAALKSKITINYSDKKILIVEDNKLNIKVARRSLEQFNFLLIDECYNGEECLKKIKTGLEYDLILMDIMMPVKDGKETLTELKKIPNFKTPVIAITADAIAGAKEKYLNQGFIDYISKPFSKEQIKVIIDKMFNVVILDKSDIWKEVPMIEITNENNEKQNH